MKTIYHIALNTFNETIRNKILYTILFFAVVVLFLSISFGDLSVFSRIQVMTDFGLAAMSITGLLLAVFIGVGLLGKELSAKTAYTVLTKPIGRPQFIFGKFLGLLSALLLNFLFIGLLFIAAISAVGGTLSGALFWAITLIGTETALIISAAIFFSTFSSPMVAAMCTIAFYITGHLNDFIVDAVNYSSPVWSTIHHLLYYLLPNLEHFNIRTRVVYDLPIPNGYLGYTILYGMLYTGLALLGASLVFSKKDL